MLLSLLNALHRSLALLLILSTTTLLTIAQPTKAHELRPSVADIEVTTDTVTLTLFLSLEPIISGIDLTDLADTNDSPLSGEHDALRALDSTGLETALRDYWPQFSQLIFLKAGDTSLAPKIVDVEIPEAGNIELPRDSVLTLSAELPAGNSAVSLTWGDSLGLLALRQVGEDAEYEAMLSGGDTSESLPRNGTITESFTSFFTQYIKIGFQHIIPKGLDHILFVIGLFLFSAAFRPLLWQVTTFTLAHTITLALATLDLIYVPATIVEPLIAASITYVAIENIIGGVLTRRRLAIIFAFGLLHGLGFASVLGEVGLQPTRFLTSLIAFNIGVEIGQLTVIAIAFLGVGLWLRHKPYYRKLIVIPASTIIGAIGAYWFITRAFF